MLPGVQSSSDFSSALYVRGSTPDQNLIMLDGIAIYNPYHLGGIFSTFNTDAINLPTGITRNTANGDLYISSSQDGKIYKITSAGVKSEFYSGLNEPWDIDIDSSNGDVYVAEKAAGKITRIAQSGTSYQYATGQTLITALARHDATGDIYFVVGYANAILKKITTSGTISTIETDLTFTRPKSLYFRENTNDLYMALGDIKTDSLDVTGTPVIYHIDVSTDNTTITEYLTNIDGNMWITSVYAPSYAPNDLYITDYASNSVLKVTKSKNTYKYVHFRKDFSGTTLEAMAPYLIIGDDTNGNLYSVNWWANAKTTSSSSYYNKDIVDNVVKITDYRFGDSYNRRRRRLINVKTDFNDRKMKRNMIGNEIGAIGLNFTVYQD